MRRYHRLAVLFALLIHCTAISSTWVEHRNLERSARALNTTDQDEVQAFIHHWAYVSQKNTPRHPPLASQVLLPNSMSNMDMMRRQDDGCTWNNGGSCSAGWRCCGSSDSGWCCPSDSICCPDGSGVCCFVNTICCLPSGEENFCCNPDQSCDNDNRLCLDKTVTETSTTTVWETETQWETVSEDATTTEETTKTEDSTVRVTVSNVDTGTTTITTTTYITDAVAHRVKRTMFAYPTKTEWLEPSEVNPTAKCTMAPPQVFNIRPAQSLNALAEVLLRRGIEIDRRDTATETNWVTETSTTTEVDTTTETEWHTEYSTDFETEEITLTNYVNAEEMVTVTETETKHVGNSDSDSDSATSDSDSDSTGDTSTSTSTSDPDSSALGDSNKSDSDDLPIGTIVGAAVGGVAGIVLILVAIWWCRRRNRNTYGPPPVVPGPNTSYHFPPPVAETQSPKPRVPVPPVHTPPAVYGHIPRDHYEADGVGVTAWTQEQRHSSTNSWGSSPPPTYARNTPGELSNTPALHARHAELASSPRIHPYEMAGSQGYHQSGYGR